MGKVSLQKIFDELDEEVDYAIAEEFYKGLQNKVDKFGNIDLQDAEIQLYIRDFMEGLEISKDYQADLANSILKQYYNDEYDIHDELEESSSEELSDVKSEEVDYSESYAKIIDQMEEANSYDELYAIAAGIKDMKIKKDVVDMLKECQADGDDYETAYSLVTSDILDMRRYDRNEANEIKKEAKKEVNAEDLVNEYLDLDREMNQDIWNSADAKERLKLTKETISAFVSKHPEVKNVIKDFIAGLEDNNWNTAAEEFGKLYKVEKKQSAYNKELITEVNDNVEVTVNGFTKSLKTVEDSQCFDRMLATLKGYEKFIMNFEADINDDCFIILGNDEDGQLYAVEFDKESWGKIIKIYTVADNIQLSKAFVDLTNNLATDFKEILM